MVSTRSHDKDAAQSMSDPAHAGDKRTAPEPTTATKKAKVEAPVDKEETKGEDNGSGDGAVNKEEKEDTKNTSVSKLEEHREEVKEQQEEKKEAKTDEVGEGGAAEVDKVNGLEEPKHGTLESGHIYFIYRPKVEVEDPESIDDVSKFHIVLLPKSAPYGSSSSFHRIISVGKKRLPEGHQVIWATVAGASSDRAGLKDAFAAYEYDTKTRGKRHQPAARPAARGHYILHSPRDPLADSPDHNRQRDFKCLLAYSLSQPSGDDFGPVQSELGLEAEGAVVVQVKDPKDESAAQVASLPKEKRAKFPTHLQSLFENRKFIPLNPPGFLDHTGAELLLIASPHSLPESLGKDGKAVESDLAKAAEHEAAGVQGALKELGLSKEDGVEVEALEGEWA